MEKVVNDTDHKIVILETKDFYASLTLEEYTNLICLHNKLLVLNK